jgi:catechol-2,3-dioxygenase
MRIDRVRLQIPDLADGARFFATVLRLPVTRDGDGLRVPVGRSRLVLSEGRRPVRGVHHLAFEVPASAFAAYRDGLRSRVPLLEGADGATEFEGPPGWNSRSVYFEGPDEMVLEVIARRNRAEPGAGGRPHLSAISEVGVAVADVPAMAAALHRTHGLEPFNGTSADFAPVGDEEGLLVLVSPGRPWYPTQRTVAEPLPLTVDATVPGAGGISALSPTASLRATPSKG